MMFFSSKADAQMRAATICLLVALLAIGYWLRARNLGDLGLLVVEGVHAQAVEGILDGGVPRFDSGIIYTRGLPFLYAQAIAAKVFGLNEFSLRLPAVLFGVGAIVAAFVLGKTVFNAAVGIVAAAVMTFSVWEIEMSRYARFYTAFQFMYLVSLLCFFRGFIRGERVYKYWFFVTACLTFVLHDLGVMLASCFLTLLLSNSYSPRRKLVFSTLAAALVSLWGLFYGAIRLQGSIPLLSSAEDSLGRGVFDKVQALAQNLYFQIPDVSLVGHLSREDPLLFHSLLFVVITATAYLVYRSREKKERWPSLLAALIIWMAFIHQIGLVLVIFLFYLALFMRDVRSLLEPPLKIVYSAVAMCLMLWVLVPAVDPAVSAKRLIWAMISYPNFYDSFLRWYIWGWPILTGVFGVGVLLLARRFISNRDARTPLFMLGAVFIPVLLASFFQPNDDTVRYTFHLYPLMVIIVAAVAVDASSYLAERFRAIGSLNKGGIITVVALATLFISQDANPVVAWSVGDWSYHTPRHPIRTIRGAGLRHHPDYKTPSLYVRERFVPGDIVMVQGGPVIVAIYHYYIGRVDYSLSNQPSIETLRWSKEGNPADVYVGSEVIAVTFKMTEQSLETLRSEGVADTVLTKLASIKNKEFRGEEDFLVALRAVVGAQPIVKYQSLFLKNAADPYCKVKEIIENNSGRGIWLVGDWKALTTSERDYRDPTKDYLRSLIHRPDYWGLDGQTFAVRLR